MCKEFWIEQYERAINRLLEEHEFDPFNPPPHIEEMAIEMANNP